MKLTKKKLEWFGQILEELQERVSLYRDVLHPNIGGSPEITSVSPYSVSVDFHWTEGCRGCYDSLSDSLSIGTEHLLRDDFSEHFQQLLAEKKEAERKKAEEQKLADTRRREAQELTEYKRLQTKFSVQT